MGQESEVRDGYCHPTVLQLFKMSNVDIFLNHNATVPIAFSIIHALEKGKAQIPEQVTLPIPAWPSVETGLFQEVRYTRAHQISSFHYP